MRPDAFPTNHRHMNQHPLYPYFAVAEQSGDLDLFSWLHSATPGASIEYHRGFLAIDRARNLSQLDEARRKRCATIADEAFSAARHNLVHLLQRRVGPNIFSYLAVARRQ
jgi:hypothetical protein